MDRKNENIFIQIPSYRDTQLCNTIESLYDNAYNKERLHITICWQHSESEKLPNKITERKNIKIIDVNYKISKGSSWARSVIQKDWNNEPYTLSLDSHLRFVKNWDKKLIDMMLSLKSNSVKKPIISGLPPSFFDPVKYPKKRLNYPLKTYPKKYEFNLLTRFYGLPIPLYKWLKAPIPAQFLAMGFLFAEGSFNAEIPFDPNIYFFGDDITTALRAYCHGYNLYHPHRLIAWHLYDRETRIPHWDDHKDWAELDKKSYERVHLILRGEHFFDFPLGSERTVDDYEKYIGQKLVKIEQNR